MTGCSEADKQAVKIILRAEKELQAADTWYETAKKENLKIKKDVKKVLVKIENKARENLPKGILKTLREQPKLLDFVQIPTDIEKKLRKFEVLAHQRLKEEHQHQLFEEAAAKKLASDGQAITDAETRIAHGRELSAQNTHFLTLIEGLNGKIWDLEIKLSRSKAENEKAGLKVQVTELKSTVAKMQGTVVNLEKENQQLKNELNAYKNGAYRSRQSHEPKSPQHSRQYIVPDGPLQQFSTHMSMANRGGIPARCMGPNATLAVPSNDTASAATVAPASLKYPVSVPRRNSTINHARGSSDFGSRNRKQYGQFIPYPELYQYNICDSYHKTGHCSNLNCTGHHTRRV